MKLMQIAVTGIAAVNAMPGQTQAQRDADHAAKQAAAAEKQALKDAKQAAREDRHNAKQALQAQKEAARDVTSVAKDDAKAFRAWERIMDDIDRQERVMQAEEDKAIRAYVKEYNAETKLAGKEGRSPDYSDIDSPATFPIYAEASIDANGDGDDDGCHGKIWFKQTSFTNTDVWYDLQGCEADFSHKFHIHAEWNAESAGDCVAAAGGHYNPWGAPDTSYREYITNMGNVQLDSNGAGKGKHGPGYVRLTDDFDTNVLTRSIVVHGDGGARISCGGPITKVDSWTVDPPADEDFF